MRGFVVTLKDNPDSVEVAERCIVSGLEHGFGIEMWPATPADEARAVLEDVQLEVASWDQQYSNPEAVLGNFCSQFGLWDLISTMTEPVLICEHDAVLTGELDDVSFRYVLQVGRPSYGNYNQARKPGVYRLFSKDGGYFPGAHAYIVTPEGGKELVEGARKFGAQPVDMFLSLRHFPWLEELYPWIARVEETFSTIQKKRGCRAKHQYSSTYRFVEP